MEIIYFLAFLCFFIYLPGNLFICYLDIPLANRKYIGTIAGLVFFTLFSFVMRYFHLPTVSIYFVYALLFLVGLLKNRNIFSSRFPVKLNKYNLVLLFILLLGILFQNSLTFRSGQTYSYGIGYWGPMAHDGIWHESLTSELIKSVPPNNPSFSSTQITSYHYFYDLLVAQTHIVSTLNIRLLIYQYYPVFFSFLLGIGVYLLSKKFYKDDATALFAVFLTYFSSSFGYIVELVKTGRLGGESTFWANQLVSYNINPPFAISLIIIIGILLFIYELPQKNNLLSFLVITILSLSLFEFKIYSALVFIPSVLLYALSRLLLKKELDWIKLILLLGISSFTALAYTFINGKQLIEYSPLWFIHSMMDYPDRLGLMKFAQARQAYIANNILVKLLILEIISTVIFFVGNIGTRVFGFLDILVNKDKYKNIFFIIPLAVSILSIAPVMLFVQKGNQWNVIQFFYYFMFISIFPFANFLALLIKKHNLFTLFFAGLLIFITPLSSIPTFRSGLYKNPVAYISQEEVGALNKINEDKENGVVLSYPYKPELRAKYTSPYPIFAYETSSYVSAYSNKDVYLEDYIQQEIFLNDYATRRIEANSFFNNKMENAHQFVCKNDIKYIYIPKGTGVENIKYEFLENFYENNEVFVYKIKPCETL